MIEREQWEQLARSIGERWGKRLKGRQSAIGGSLGAWPCGLSDARRLIDDLLGARLTDEEREPLAIIAERSARGIWYRKQPFAA